MEEEYSSITGLGPIGEIGLWWGADLVGAWGASSLTRIPANAGAYSPAKFTTGKVEWFKSHIYDNSATAIEHRAAARAYAKLQSDALSRAVAKATMVRGRGGLSAIKGMGRMGAAFGRELGTIAEREGLGYTIPLLRTKLSGKIGGGIGLGASIAAKAISKGLMSYMLVEGVTSIGGLAIDYLTEIGKPRDIKPRFYDTMFNATMRQSGLAAIHESQLNTRSSFGREASYSHI